MIKSTTKLLLLIVCLVFASCTNKEGQQYSFSKEENSPIQIYIHQDEDELIKWAGKDFASDLEVLTGRKVHVEINASNSAENAGIYIGTVNSALLQQQFSSQLKEIEGKWECFSVQKVSDKLLIAGSDIRGAVYGIFDVAERLGVSPWKWWADVHPQVKKELVLDLPQGGIVESPSVKFRGIFLNDEDWGLQPWAAKTFEPQVGDIGPKTYEKIFQLMLRLKANTIWPAMHKSTQPFFTIEGNKEMAQKYKIVLGTSHAEPMLRNNVREWNHKERGAFNYFINSDQVKDYWQERVTELSETGNDCLFTIGMRGVHDSKMEGASSKEEMVDIMHTIMQDQREMLASTFKKEASEIPQVLVPYKEVLDLYNAGLQVPEDVSLMWCDDNYGYIRRLSNEEEQKRSGGSGVYYHLSYWGRPHDYLWLSTTQPGLIWYEMTRAYENGADQIWIANVGDIKPAEYNMEFFMDLAWDIHSIKANAIKAHQKAFYSREFGAKAGAVIGNIMNEYYRLAFIRKPEYMGWSQTEPSTPTRESAFNQFANDNELQRRIDAYHQLVIKVKELKEDIKSPLMDAYFQLVEYPVKGASWMNAKFLYAQLALEADNPEDKSEYIMDVEEAHQGIQIITAMYNEKISKGKWEGMMDCKPRNLAVYQMPEFHLMENTTTKEEVDTNLPDPIFIQANDFAEANGAGEYKWQSVEGLGYSDAALTLYPFKQSYFKEEMPAVNYNFEIEEAGEYEVVIHCLPTHSNNYDHQLKVSVDKENAKDFELNTKGRSREWKENVLRNAKEIRYKVDIKESGNHVLTLAVNQTGIVIDQIAIQPKAYAPYYEMKK